MKCHLKLLSNLISLFLISSRKITRKASNKTPDRKTTKYQISFGSLSSNVTALFKKNCAGWLDGTFLKSRGCTNVVELFVNLKTTYGNIGLGATTAKQLNNRIFSLELSKGLH